MKWGLLLFSLLLVQLASAATIQGIVYDISLDKVKNIVVTIDSAPSQRFVVSDGRYSFDVPSGDYTIKVLNVNGDKSLASEYITVWSEGTYNLDIILFPEEELEDISVDDIAVPEPLEDLEAENGKNPWLGLGVIILGVALFLLMRLYKKRDMENVIAGRSDSEKVIEIMKKEGGRINQKDLRKHFPLSEAKISLLVSELEAKGKIEKIKKGRGNILVLKD